MLKTKPCLRRRNQEHGNWGENKQMDDGNLQKLIETVERLEREVDMLILLLKKQERTEMYRDRIIARNQMRIEGICEALRPDLFKIDKKEKTMESSGIYG